MATTRSFDKAFEVTSYTAEVNDLDPQYGLFNGMGLFQGEGVSTESIVFEKETRKNVLIPQKSRADQRSHKGADRKVETFSLPIPYFNVEDAITARDIQNKRLEGTPDSPQNYANVLNKKMMDMRTDAEQTLEWMKIQAIKGKTMSPDGAVIADMLGLFGLDRANLQIDFELGNAGTNIDAKISELKRTLARTGKTGSRIGGIEVPCSPEFFDQLTTHQKMREAYNYYQNSGKQLNRDSLSQYRDWGVMDFFEHKGVLFYSYDAEFTLPDGSTDRAFEANEGYTIVQGVRDLYRANYAPSDRISEANTMGQEMYFYTYRDPRDKMIELELEMAPLLWMTRPQLSYRVYTS